MARQRMIRASEIGEYVYCRRAWWLHWIEGETPSGRARRERGTALHARHGQRVWLSQALIVGSVLLMLAALSVLVLR